MNLVSLLPAPLGSPIYISLVISSVGLSLIPQRDIKLTVLVALGQASLWSVINLGVAILCACLPTYGPLLLKIGTLGSSAGSRQTKSSHAGASTTKLNTSSGTSANYSTRSGYYHKMDDSTSDAVPLTEVAAEGERDAKFPRIPFHGIRVQRDFEVV